VSRGRSVFAFVARLISVTARVPLGATSIPQISLG